MGGGWAGRQPAPWEAGPSFVRRRWTNPPSPATHVVTHVLRSGLSRSQEVTRTELVEAAGTPSSVPQGPATHTPRDERTELVSFHRSAKAPHAPPYPARCTVGLFPSLAISRGRTTDVQDKGSCGRGGVCFLTGQVGGLAATAIQSGEGHSQAHFTPFQSYSATTSPLSAALKRGLCRPDLHDSAPSDQRQQECLARSRRAPAGACGRIAILAPASLGRNRQGQGCGKN